MRIFSKIGAFTFILGVVLLGLVFWHYGGFVDPTVALARMLSILFYGAILWFGLFCLLMALLFLNA